MRKSGGGVSNNGGGGANVNGGTISGASSTVPSRGSGAGMSHVSSAKKGGGGV